MKHINKLLPRMAAIAGVCFLSSLSPAQAATHGKDITLQNEFVSVRYHQAGTMDIVWKDGHKLLGISSGARLEDGRSLPSNYREFTHGYAVTAHRSQGKTVDKVIISADAMKQELFYVAASRGREDIAIITSDANRLGESLGVSMARPSAMELASRIAQSVQAP